MPDVPTFTELGLPAYDVSAWFGIFAPAGVPAPIVERLNGAIRKAIESPEMQAQLATAGAEPMYGAASEFAAIVGADFRKWTGVIRERGIRFEG
jgi:tripartite-type tricarboxylate transporter receptor subunit TctC